VKTAFDDTTARRTDDLIGIITAGKLPNLCVLSHCERWCEDVFAFSRRFALDLAFSWGKSAISAYRKVGQRT
jgi:hypothetical protein